MVPSEVGVVGRDAVDLRIVALGETEEMKSGEMAARLMHHGQDADSIMFSMANTYPLDILSLRASSPTGPPLLLLCEGKDCAKKQKCAYRKLAKAAGDAEVTVGLIGCQGSCTGPTAVVVDENGPRWFEDLKKPKSHEDVIALATGRATKPSKRLKKRELKGKQRKRALKRIGKGIALSPTVQS